ncbi:unnamed protein product [Paramecium primaurelia]|uniref:IPT/TIG domain-containing protein n=1 Tax=Paramecium primaurelia TaxID=5886 RepID=A0A8S1K3X6_PARPR|nr:unnamed protein product [Paramecium primaurelia]
MIQQELNHKILILFLLHILHYEFNQEEECHVIIQLLLEKIMVIYMLILLIIYLNKSSITTLLLLEYGSSQKKDSKAGGTVIHITGCNFIKGKIFVFVGIAVNWFYESIFTIEVIYCTAPTKY